MGLSTQLLLLALLAGGAGAVLFWRQHRLGVLKTLLLIGLVIGGATVFVAASWATERWIESQGAAHAVYLLAVVALPVVAAAAWTRAMVLHADEPDAVGRGVLSITMLLTLLPALGGVYATHIEPSWLRVDRHRVEVAVPEQIRIAVVADMHLTQVDAYAHRALARAVAEQPDVLVFAGDLWDMAPEQLPQHEVELRQLIERATAEVPVVVVVPGDSDAVPDLARIARDAGAVPLDGEARQFDIGGGIVIGGVTEFDRQGQRDAIGALAATPPGIARLLVSHSPDIVNELSGVTAIDLIVSGHTHGGQIALPLLGPIMTRSSVANEVAAGGLHDYLGQRLYVSTGVGVERQESPQVRFGVRPSVGIIDLVPSGS